MEQEQVSFIFGSIGTTPNLAVRQYLNDNKVPQLFVTSGSSLFADPEHFPRTMAWQPTYRAEARIYGKHILASRPDAKIAILYQNDAFGRDYLDGLKDALGDKFSQMVVKTAPYETSEPTVDSQMIALQGSGASVLIIATTPKFAAQAIRKSYDLEWKGNRYLSSASPSIATVLKPAGLEQSKGIICVNYTKDPTDPRWADDSGMALWRDFCGKYLDSNAINDFNAVFAFCVAGTIAKVLEQCGDDLSRQNVLKQATQIQALSLPALLPNVLTNTSATNYNPIRQMQLVTFDGARWRLTGDLIAD